MPMDIAAKKPNKNTVEQDKILDSQFISVKHSRKKKCSCPSAKPGEEHRLLASQGCREACPIFLSQLRSGQGRQWHPTPVLLPGKPHGQRSLVGCSPWGRKELDTTQRLHFHFSLSCIGEGNGNPFQCSCLEAPRDCGAWWAAAYGVAPSRTRLKRLSSSRSREGQSGSWDFHTAIS